jgi:hypothetical protein
MLLKKTTSKAKPTVSKSEYDKAVAEIKSKEADIANLQTAIEALTSEREISANVIKSSVPKDKLQNETIFERIAWYFRDLNTWQKVIAYTVLGLAFVGLIFGAVYANNNLDEASMAYKLITAAVNAVLALLTGGTLISGIAYNPKK